MIERLRYWVWLLGHYFRELAARWYCWRHNVIRLAKVIRVHQIRVGNVCQLFAEVPGEMFTNGSVADRHIDGARAMNVRADPGCGMTIEVENVGTEPVSFLASVFFRSVVDDSLQGLSFPVTLLPVNRKTSVVVIFPCAAQILDLMIPKYSPRGLP